MKKKVMLESVSEVDSWNRYSLLFLRIRFFGCLASPFICLIMQSERDGWTILALKASPNKEISQNGIQLRSISIGRLALTKPRRMLAPRVP